MARSSKKPVLQSPTTASELLDMYFLDARSHLLEAASILDRIERAPKKAGVSNDPRLQKLRSACDILKDCKKRRTEQFLILFSEP